MPNCPPAKPPTGASPVVIANASDMPTCTDRTQLVPSHIAPRIFPNSPLFSRLVQHAHRKRLAIRDLNTGVSKTYGELLSDVLGVRGVLAQSLDEETLKALYGGEEIFIGLLAPGGYEYTVGFLAILAIGAAVVPMSISHPVHEAQYYVLKSKQVAILSASAHAKLGADIQKSVVAGSGGEVKHLDIGGILRAGVRSTPVERMLVSSNNYLDDNAAGVVIFTSGTTGLPKGAVMRRAYVHDSATSVADHYSIVPSDVILHLLPVHHATGVGISFLPFLISGAAIEFKSGSFDPAWTWNRFRSGGLTFFSGVPTIYMRMMRYYEQHLGNTLPVETREEYLRGAKEFRVMLCGSSALPGPISEFWTRIRGGRGILTRYGATEFGAVIKVGLDGDAPAGSVGRAFAGCDVKLSEGSEGEILVKSPHMFSKYVLPFHTHTYRHSRGYIHFIHSIHANNPFTDTYTTTPPPTQPTHPRAISGRATSRGAPHQVTTSSSAAPPSTSSNPADTRSPRSTSNARSSACPTSAKSWLSASRTTSSGSASRPS
jgi:malonyl-CoA/methylmalonyl-CoA synthetase